LFFSSGIITWDSVLENPSEKKLRRNPLLQVTEAFVLVRVGLLEQQLDARRR
jgi:hypothetical protein